MSLEPGRDLSHYRIVDRIGEGGMGVVWRATDSTLGRDVAIKVLPDLFAADPERLARFEREAKLLASLNHPHIAAIYGLHSADGVRFLAMELVEGEDLAQRLERGALPVPEAVAIALQIAQALEHAHERGVIHRDLKPANVKLGAEGKAKVLDFGLAKALEGEGGRPASSSVMSQSPTITGHMTGANVLLGTAAYMAPEQARGYAADRRADIWAFGVLLMEMLTGKRLFDGETISDTLASVLKTDVDFAALPKETPSRVRALLARCLSRDPKRRLRDIGEARITLEDVLAGPAEEAAPQAAPSRSRIPVWAIAAGALALGAIATFAVLGTAPSPRGQAPLRKFRLPVPPSEGSTPQYPVISPDGRTVAYVHANALWTHSLGELEPRQLKAERDVSHLFWSPDGKHLGYFAGTRIMKIALDGGENQAVCDVRGAVTGGGGASWGDDGTIVFSRGDSAGLLQVSALGGDPKPLLKPDSTESDFHEPFVLPGGRGVIFGVHRLVGGTNSIGVVSGGKRKTLLEVGDQRVSTPIYDPSGYLLFQRQPTTAGVWALPFSLSRLETAGDAFLVLPGGSLPSVSNEGTLTAISGGSAGPRQMTWWGADGLEQGPIGQPEARAGSPAVSPDGRSVVWAVTENDNRDLWILDTARGTRTRLTFDPVLDDAPAWSPSGDRIAYHGNATSGGLAAGFVALVRAADGTGAADTVARLAVNPVFTPDGRRLTYVGLEGGGARWNLDEVALEGDRTPRHLLRGNPRISEGRVSPSGQFLAYMSDESSRWEIYLTRYPSCEGRWQVSAAGGQWPRWNARGDRLHFVQDDDVMEVAVSGTTAPVLGTPRRLFTRPSLGSLGFNWVVPFDVTGDGKRFLILRAAGQERRAQGVAVVQSWASEFARDRRAAKAP